jgi:hypothetical protein
VAVSGVHVRPEINQEPCDRGPVLCGGVVQGRAMMLVAAHAGAEKRRIARDEPPYLIGSIERNRGPEIELRSVAQKIVHHVFAHARQRSGPAEHAEVVVIARAHDIGARFHQHLDDREVGGFCGEVDGVGVVAVVADANVGAALQQQPHAGRVVSPSGLVQRGLLLEVSAAGIDQIGMPVEQRTQLLDAAVLGGGEKRIDRPPLLRRACVALLELAREQLDGRLPIGLGDLVNGAPVGIGRAGVEAGLESAANRFDIAHARRVENAFAFALRRIAAVNMRLELPPAGEAVFARQSELDSGELGLRVLLAQRLEALLGLVLEVLEAWARRQRSGATRRRTRIVCHENLPSICARRPRISGRKSGYVRS